MKRGVLLVIGILVVLAAGCAEPQAVPAEPAPAAPAPLPAKEAPRPMPPEPALPRPAEPAGEIDVEPEADLEEELPPGFAKLTLADPDDPIEIVSWGIERGPSDSAELVNVTLIVRNTGREPLTGQVLFEAWQESIFFKKTWDIGQDVPPGQSYTFTRGVNQNLDAPKLEKQMRAVLIVIDGIAAGGEDHKFFVPIKR